jgi:Ca2+-binding EF-hand superfamily protein
MVLKKVKEKVKALLKTCLGNNSSYMRESQVAALLKEKTQGKLEEREWTSVISLMYSQEEAELIVQQIKDSISKKSEGRSGKSTFDEILYSEFLNVVLGYDLNSHELLLEPFCQVFSRADSDSDGIVTRDEFLNICSNLAAENPSELLLKIDPFNIGKMTFSMCVKLFTEENMPESKGNFSLLHGLFFAKHGEEQF